jgi:HEAT repeat protein
MKVIRNPATHSELYTFEEAINFRDIIVKNLNNIAWILYRDPEIVKHKAKSSLADDRVDSIKSLMAINEPWCSQLLIELLNDSDQQIQMKAAEALTETGDLQAIPYLEKFTDSGYVGLKYASRSAIQAIKGRNSD